MLKGLFSLLLTVGVLLFVGCTSPQTVHTEPQVTPKNNRVGEKLIEAFFQNNAKLFLAELPPEIRSKFGEKDFEQTRKGMIEKLGNPVQYSYLLNLEHPMATISVWKLKFVRKNLETNKVYTQEILFRAAYASANGKPMLLSFNFL